MSGTLKQKAKKTECTCAKYFDESTYNGDKAHLVFVGYVIKGDTHIYDSMVMFKGIPSKQYSQCEILKENEDFTATYDLWGFPIGFEFI